MEIIYNWSKKKIDIRITEALNARLVNNVAFRAGTTVDLVTNINGKKDAVVAYLAIDKK